MNNVSKQVSVESLAEEYLERKRRGESPAISEYKTKYPDLADEIEEIFPAMELMEDFKPASGDLSDESASSRPAISSLKQVADYRILKEIGRGGMGVVYEAEQQSLGRRVALKILPKSSVGGTKMLDRFQREARAAAKMHHTNIVPVFEVGSDEQCAFYAMQLIQGQGLDAVIGDLRDLRSAHTGSQNDPNQVGRRNSLAHSLVTGHFDCARLDDSASEDANDNNPALIETIVAAGGSTVSASLPGEGDLSTAEDNRRAYFRSVAEVGHQCAEALSYAHARGIIHRDIKPSNLLLDTNGVVWVTDFGLAKTSDVGLTQTGDILGTIRYMSPERFKGQCDNRADVYSLGLTLYEMLVLTPAYESPVRLKLIDIVTKTEITAPRSIDSRIPRDLETIVLKASDKDPKRRYQSADEMADDLQRFLNDEPILARRVSPTERIARWTRRNPWLATAMSVSAAALIVITGISIAAAQTQSQLNGQLAEANEEEKQLNAELKQKTDEQRKTNQALVESNKSKEELIRDLKKSQSILAEKQAEFVAEKGDVAESMLLLAKSYELADGQSPEYRRNLLSKLEAAGTAMPRLVSVVEAHQTTSSSNLRAELQGMTRRGEWQRMTDEQRAPFLQRLRNDGSSLRAAQSVLSNDHMLMAIPYISQRQSKSSDSEQHLIVRIWDVKTSSFTGMAIEPKSRLQNLAVDSEERILAAVTWEASEDTKPSDEAQTSQNGRSRSLGDQPGTLSMVVWSIDSGKVLLETSIVEDVTLDVALARSRVQTPIRLRNKATELVRVSAKTTDEIVIKVHDVRTGEVLCKTRIALNESVAVSTPILSRDGRRLVCLAADSAGRGLFGDGVDATLSCYDVDTGQQVGKSIHKTTRWPVPSFGLKLLTPDGQRVAFRRGSGDAQHIEILDFERGHQDRSDIWFSRLSGFTVKLLNASSDGSHLAVSIEPPRARASARTNPQATQEPQFGSIQIFDVKSGEAVMPRLPTTSEKKLVALPSRASTMTVHTANQIRSWQLPHSPMRGELVPWKTAGGVRGQASALFELQTIMATRSGGRNLRSSTGQTTGVLATNRQGHILLANQSTRGIQVQRWERKSGRLHSVIDLPETHSNLIGPFCPQGQYLLTVPLETERLKRQMQVWSIETGTQHGEPFTLPDDTMPLALSSDGNFVFLMKLPRNNRRRGNGFGVGRSAEFSVLNRETGDTQQLPEQLPEQQGGFGGSARFSADGRYLLFGSKGVLRRYNMQDGVMETDSAAQQGEGRIGSGQVWTASGDGQVIASTDNTNSVFLQSYAGTSQFGRDDNVLAELKHPARVTNMTFDPGGRVLITAASDGIIRQWALPERWQGDAAAINQRTQRHTGLALNDAGNVIASELVPRAHDRKGTADEAAGLPDNSTTDDYTNDQFEAIRLRSAEQWEDAEAAFAEWALKQPQDWRPDVLRLRPLVQLNRFDEADAAWKRAASRIGNDSAFAWLKIDATRHSSKIALEFRSQRDGLRGARFNNADPESAPITAWYSSRLLDRAPDNATKAGALFNMAKAYELEVRLEEAADAINKAVVLEPDSADIHYYRAHLMERLNRWDEALRSRQELLRLEPEHRDAHHRVVAAHLFAGDKEAFGASWAKFLSDKAEIITQENTLRNSLRDRLAKTRLLAGSSDDDSLRKALELADANFDDERGPRDLQGWVTLTKGIAEYRRGKHEAAVEHLDSAMKLLSDPAVQASNFARGVAMTRFVAAMAHHKLGRSDAATDAYFDGLDRHTRDDNFVRSSSLYAWTDWKLAEVARREAALLLKVDEESVDSKIPDTSNWKVLLEEDFDDGISDDWQQVTGEWTVVDGAAGGTLEQPDGKIEAFSRLDRELPDLPSTFEVEYEVWTDKPMLAACFLRKSGPPSRLSGHRVALASYPDRQLTNQGKPGTGVNLVVQTEFGFWVEDAVSDLKVQPNQHYKVRILRQPQRITVFIDGKQVMTHRVRNIETKTIRFFARGEEGTKIFIDNVRLRTPGDVARKER